MHPDEMDVQNEDKDARRIARHRAQQWRVRQQYMQQYMEVMVGLLSIEDPVADASLFIHLQRQRRALEILFDTEVYPSFAPATSEVFLHSTYAYTMRQPEEV